MVESSLSGLLSPVKDAVTGGGSEVASTGAGNAGLWAFAGIFIAIAVVVLIGAGIYWWVTEKKMWNMKTRVHAENPNIKGVSLCNATILTRRVRFKDGKVCFLFKNPIQGYTISPELMIYTRPMEYDIIVTQDKKLFCLRGIEDINVKRKILNVDITHPDIEMDRQDLQNHIDSKKYDDPNERLKIILKTATYVVLGIMLLVIIVVGCKYYLDSKELDVQRDQVNLQVAENNLKATEALNTFLRITGYDTNTNNGVSG